jgi:hypothetical protein
MPISVLKARDVLKWSIRLAVVALAIAPAGCSPEGAGSIKIEDPQAVRAKGEGLESKMPPKSAKQAKAIQIEEEAAKKNPKLR